MGDLDSVPGLGRSPGEENGYPLQYSGLENSMEREAWRATVHGVAESDVTERLSLSLFKEGKNVPFPVVSYLRPTIHMAWILGKPLFLLLPSPHPR